MGIAAVFYPQRLGRGQRQPAQWDLPVHSLVEHWDGTRWKVVAGPGSPRLPTLAGVAASSAKNAWAVSALVPATAA